MEKEGITMQAQKEVMNKIKKERIAIFIDGNNFYHSIREILKPNERIDYYKLINLLAEERDLILALYYVAPLDKEVDYNKYLKHQEFLSKLDQIPKFKVILCSFKKIKQINGNFTYIIKGDDIKLAHDLLLGSFDNRFDVATIVSGDEDFLPLITTIRKRFGKKVGNAYFRRSSSYKLRMACDFYINLNKL